jgi:hypothetical protein
LLRIAAEKGTGAAIPLTAPADLVVIAVSSYQDIGEALLIAFPFYEYRCCRLALRAIAPPGSN